MAGEDENGKEIYEVCFNGDSFVGFLNNVRFKKRRSVARLKSRPDERVKKSINS